MPRRSLPPLRRKELEEKSRQARMELEDFDRKARERQRERER